MRKTIRISNWKTLVGMADEFPAHVFRGQADSQWALEGSLHRTLEANYVSECCDVLEYFLLREFKRGARRYLASTPADDDLVSWLSLMQHHGAPTRLIDFTHSFYVAAYFALIGTVGESALWVVDLEALFHAADIARSTGDHGVPEEWEGAANAKANSFLRSRLSDAITAAKDSDQLGVIPVEPLDLHPRLAIQQGMFLMPLNPFLDIDGNLKPHGKQAGRAVRKIVISQAVRAEGLRHLRDMNITAETLFPGIDGFTRSLVHKVLP